MLIPEGYQADRVDKSVVRIVVVAGDAFGV